MKPPKNASTKCTQSVRAIPLEQFRLPRDKRKWKQAARTRQEFLMRLSTYANGDGTFIGADGTDYSPSEKKIIKHVAKSSYYLLSDDLQELGWLSWTREQKHYGQRSFTIHLENHIQDSSKTPPAFKPEHLSHSPKTPPRFKEEHLQDSSITPPTTGGDNTSNHWTNPSYPNAAPEIAENPRSKSAAAMTADAGAQSETGAAAGSTLTAATATAVAVAAKYPAKVTTLPSTPTTGRKAGVPSGDVYTDRRAAVEFSVDAVTEGTPRQIQEQSRKEYAKEKSGEFRKLPQDVRDRVKRLRQRCREEWDYWRGHDEDGVAVADGNDRLPGFSSPKDGDLLKLARLLETYTEPQILGAWKKYANRTKGFEGMVSVWTNFFLEFEDYVDVEQTVGGAA